MTPNSVMHRDWSIPSIVLPTAATRRNKVQSIVREFNAVVSETLTGYLSRGPAYNASGAGFAAPSGYTQYNINNISVVGLNSSVHDSFDSDDGRNRYLVYIITVFLSLMVLITIVANFLILLGFCTSTKLHKPTNYFYVSMAISDFAAGILVLPLAVYDWFQNEDWQLGKGICVFWVSMDFFLYTVSAYNMCGICFDRYLAIFHGFWYRPRRSGKLVLKFIFAAWIFGFLLQVPVIALWEIVSGNSTIDYDEYCDVEFANHSVYTTIAMFISPVIPCTFIFILYLRIYLAIRRRSIKRNSSIDKLLTSTERRVTGSGQKASGHRKRKRTEWINLKEIRPQMNTRVILGHKIAGGRTHRYKEAARCEREFDVCNDPGRGRSPNRHHIEDSNRRNIVNNRNASIETTISGDSATSTNLNVSLKEDNNSAAEGDSDREFNEFQLNTNTNEKRLSRASNLSLGVYTDKSVQGTPYKDRKPRNKVIIGQSASDRRAAVLLTILVGFFLVSYAPWVIISIVEAVYNDDISFAVYTTAVWLQYVNSLINPFLYVYQDLDFRHAVLAVLRLRRDKAGIDLSSYSV
ncbi:histamine H1 receptor-like [Saccoglossus kowalevskii]|uniref:Histamine H4 receptor-like n=1 Tax=Saccoglossus kowalevskii TaxID=10224 RepID=A0ABM0M868_SACKO|nr:PREDICTED: histamine H4 receptor-like [Saccoglossus kowalevskii]